MRLDAEYVLPLKWSRDDGLDDLIGYLARLAPLIDVTVVDGSAPAEFDSHARRMPAGVRHVAPKPWPGRNGKVAGVMTGVHGSRHERIVIADDDIRYDRATLERVVDLLDHAAVVRPQNYFLDLPWHARWDTARTLINRAIGSDYPGTLAVRRSVLLAAGGYDGDVLFENRELIRTMVAAGGRELREPSLFVGRKAPDAAHFIHQRVRQAYDDLAQPGRLIAELLVLPVALLSVRSPSHVVLAAAGVMAVAEAGRHRSGGTAVFAPTAALWAPAWVAERAVCVWVALARRATGGIRYAGQRIPRAGTRRGVLRRRMLQRGVVRRRVVVAA